MLLVTVEVWPGGYEGARHKIGQGVIWRTGGSLSVKDANDYLGVLTDMRRIDDDGDPLAHPLDVAHEGKRLMVSGHKYDDGFWPLIRKFAAKQAEMDDLEQS